MSGMRRVTIPITPPPPREPMNVRSLPSARGERIVWATVVDGEERLTHQYGYRAWSDVFEADDRLYLFVVPEREWWSHELLGTLPCQIIRIPAAGAFVE